MGPDCIRLHSAYDPVREAERFVVTAIREKNPRCIVITEPGESYLANVLRNRFPHTTLLALRYTTDRFNDSDQVWTAVWRPGGSETLPDFLYRVIPEEYIPQTVFLPWKPADSIWPETARTVWNGIADMVRLQAGIIRTRTHFGKRWLANMVNSVVFARAPVQLSGLAGPVLLACSGPSLETIFPLDTHSIHIVAVSSALSTLAGNGIIPDICITTDGGYWAREHVRSCPSGTIVAFPPEAAIPVNILETNPVVFLSFSSCLEQKLFDLAGITPVPAERNGTVAGTAVRYLLENGRGPVIAAGLDLSATVSFSHARPHAFDAVLNAMADRITPLCGILHDRTENSFALDAYARWFETHRESFGGRLFRIPASIRSIPGIPIGDIKPVSGGTKISIQQVRQSVPDPAVRATRVSNYLKDRAETLLRYAPDMEKIPDVVELLQLVSFSRYVSAMKSGNFRDLCVETSRYLDRLAERIIRRVR